MPLISRRRALVPIAAGLTVPAFAVQARNGNAPPPVPIPPPDRYDEPLGIGLEGWPYPAPVRFQQGAAFGQAVRMAYMDVPPSGRSRNRTIVLLHGKSFDSSYWAGPIRAFAAAGFRVVVPDQIGFNKSSKPDITYSFDLLAEWTVNLLGSLQIGQAVVLGHSTGGMLAVRLAAVYPQRVERLILEDPIGLVDYRRYVPPQSLETLVAAEKRRTAATYRAFLRRYFPVLPAKEMEPFVEWRMRVGQSSEYDRFCKATALTYQMIYREPMRDLYAEVTVPTLVIVGEKDVAAPLIHYAPPEVAARMPSIPQAAPAAVADLRKGSLVTIPGVGHVPHLEAADIFADKVIAFLTG